MAGRQACQWEELREERDPTSWYLVFGMMFDQVMGFGMLMVGWVEGSGASRWRERNVRPVLSQIWTAWLRSDGDAVDG